MSDTSTSSGIPETEFDVLQQLHAADQTCPPPPGRPITSAGLQQRLQRRRRKALVVAAALTLIGLGISTLVNTPVAAGATTSVDGDLHADLDALSIRVDRLLADLAAPLPTPLPTPLPSVNNSNQQLRYELANARANALIAMHISPPSTPTRPTTNKIR